ncbi:MAG TPA: DNA mismatch repair protein MutS [bacterium]|nr:DNA mismatch repair protein MutS [bacterium]
MVLDAATRSSLELVEPLRGTDDTATLLGAVRRTVTPMGARLLREWLVRPLVDPAAISRRLETVEGLISRRDILTSVRSRLKEVRDLQRLIARIACGTPNPRDLGAVRQSLKAVPGFREELAGFADGIWEDIRAGLHDFTSLVELLERGLVDTPPLSPGDGGVIREGFDGELDGIRRLAREGKDWISRYQAEEIERTGVKSLKVRYNRVFGYFIEITKANLASVPDHYLRKQTLANAERFITDELKEYEDKVLGAQERAAAMEYALFEKLRDAVRERERLIQETAGSLALLDVAAGFADTALAHNFVRPIVEESGVLTIRNGRHPVVEQTVAAGNFVGNDTEMDGAESQIHIITGPNMAGKSTYIRQVALIVLLAQTGSFVPADYARIGCADRIFARVGASDDLSRGQSTFMVEMTETANILHHATPRSLIILDEIGRGTSTFDGISIAWAVAEYLHNRPARKARTLFATHYHELTELELTLPGVKNFNVAVREWNDRVIFLRKVVPGGTDRSYGIQVARLAGLPRAVIERANRILSGLESGTLSADGKPKFAVSLPSPDTGGQQLTLFETETDPVVDELRSMRLEFMTPFEAMQRLKELKDRLDRSGCRG